MARHRQRASRSDVGPSRSPRWCHRLGRVAERRARRSNARRGSSVGRRSGRHRSSSAPRVRRRLVVGPSIRRVGRRIRRLVGRAPRLLDDRSRSSRATAARTSRDGRRVHRSTHSTRSSRSRRERHRCTTTPLDARHRSGDGARGRRRLPNSHPSPRPLRRDLLGERARHSNRGSHHEDPQRLDARRPRPDRRPVAIEPARNARRDRRLERRGTGVPPVDHVERGARERNEGPPSRSVRTNPRVDARESIRTGHVLRGSRLLRRRDHQQHAVVDQGRTGLQPSVASRRRKPDLPRPESVLRHVDPLGGRHAPRSGRGRRLRPDRRGDPRTPRPARRARQCRVEPLSRTRDQSRTPRPWFDRLLARSSLAHVEHPLGHRRTCRAGSRVARTRRLLRVRTDRTRGRREPQPMARDHRSGSLRRTGRRCRGSDVRGLRESIRRLR